MSDDHAMNIVNEVERRKRARMRRWTALGAIGWVVFVLWMIGWVLA